MNEDLCLRAPTWPHYPIKLGGSLAPEIALKCNIDAAILGILPLRTRRGPGDAAATSDDREDLSVCNGSCRRFPVENEWEEIDKHA